MLEVIIKNSNNSSGKTLIGEDKIEIDEFNEVIQKYNVSNMFVKNMTCVYDEIEANQVFGRAEIMKI